MDALKKYGFWIGIGLAVVAAVALHFVLVRPMAARNQDLWKKLKERRDKLTKFASDRQLKNENWIKFEKRRAEFWAEQKKRCERYLRRPDPFESVFKDADGRVITTRTDWVNTFRRRVAAMIRRIQSAGIEVGESAFKCQTLAEAWKAFHPQKPVLRKATHSFYIQEEFAKILTQKSLNLAEIDYVHIGDAAEGLLRDLGKVEVPGIFTTHPYQISVYMDFEDVQHLFRELLSSRRLMLSIERIGVGQPQGKQSKKRPNLVHIVVTGRYMDFSVGKKEKT